MAHSGRDFSHALDDLRNLHNYFLLMSYECTFTVNIFLRLGLKLASQSSFGLPGAIPWNLWGGLMPKNGNPNSGKCGTPWCALAGNATCIMH